MEAFKGIKKIKKVLPEEKNACGACEPEILPDTEIFFAPVSLRIFYKFT